MRRMELQRIRGVRTWQRPGSTVALPHLPKMSLEVENLVLGHSCKLVTTLLILPRGYTDLLLHRAWCNSEITVHSESSNTAETVCAGEARINR